MKKMTAYTLSGLLLLLSCAAQAADITLVWDQVPDAEGYRLAWGTNSGQYSWSVDTTNTTAIATNCQPGVTYYFAVSSLAYGYPWGYSPEAHYRISVPQPPGGLIITLVQVAGSDGTLRTLYAATNSLNSVEGK